MRGPVGDEVYSNHQGRLYYLYLSSKYLIYFFAKPTVVAGCHACISICLPAVGSGLLKSTSVTILWVLHALEHDRYGGVARAHRRLVLSDGFSNPNTEQLHHNLKALPPSITNSMHLTSLKCIQKPARRVILRSHSSAPTTTRSHHTTRSHIALHVSACLCVSPGFTTRPRKAEALHHHACNHTILSIPRCTRTHHETTTHTSSPTHPPPSSQPTPQQPTAQPPREKF